MKRSFFRVFYSNLPHIVAILVIITVPLMICQKLVFTSGLIMHGDFYFPLYLKRYTSRFYPLWDSFGSASTLTWLSRITFMIPFIVVASSLNIDIMIFAKGMTVGILILIGLSMYWSTNVFLKKVFKDINQTSIVTASIISSMVYMFNPWAMERIVHYYLLIGYALTPLVLSSFMESLKTRKSTYILATAFLWSLASSSVHYAFFIGVLIFSWLIYSTLIYAGKFGVLKRIKVTLLTIVFYVAFSSYWIVPYLMATFITHLGPTSVVSYEVIDMLSRNSNLPNVIRLSGYWWPRLRHQYPLVHEIAGFVLPSIASLALLLKSKDKYVIYFSLMTSILISLAMGSKSPLPYEWLIFSAPFSKAFGWLFRDPNKWVGLLALTYSFFTGVTVLGLIKRLSINKMAILRWNSRKQIKRIIGIVIISLLILSFAFYAEPYVSGYLGDNFVPVEVPQEYYSINNWIANEAGDYRVLWLPSFRGRGSSWAPDKAIGPIDIVSSMKPTMGPFTLYAAHYGNYIYESLLNDRTTNFGKYLDFLNTRYVLFHDDIIGAEMEAETAIRILADQRDLEFVKQEGFIHVFENEHYSPHILVPTQSFLVIGGLDTFTSLCSIENLRPGDSALIFLEQGLYGASSNVGDIISSISKLEDLAIAFTDEKYVIASFDYTNHHNASRLWSKARATNPLHGSWSPYLERRDIDNWDFDYGRGLVLTWAPFILEEPSSLKDGDLISRFDFEDKNLGNWSVNAENIQIVFLCEDAYEGAYSLKAELYNSTQGWKKINSPLIPANYGDQYKWQFYTKAENVDRMHAKIIEYNENKTEITVQRVATIESSDFNWKKVSFNFAPESAETAYMQLQVWHGHETTQPLPNKIWFDNVKVYDLKDYLKPNTLEMSFATQTTGTYELYIRYFQNKDGGKIGLYLDGKLIEIIDTKDQINRFTWKKIGTYNLDSGTKTLTLENKEGFNAVNLFALISKEKAAELEETIKSLLQNKRIIYVLEAESDMYAENSFISNKYGGEASNGEVLELTLLSRVWNELEILKPGNYTIVIRGKGNLNIRIDEKEYTTNSTQLNWTYLGPISLEKGKHKIEITPSLTHYSQWEWDFENGELQEWQGNFPGIQTLSLDEKPYEGNYSLKAELYASSWGWKVIQSPMIPVTPRTRYKCDFYVAGENAHSVHAKIVEYNVNKKSIAEYYMAGIGGGNFTWKNINFEYTASQNASYINLQIWHGHETTQPLPNKVWIDNVKVYDYQPSDLDVVWLYSTQKEDETLEEIFTPKEIPAEIISYQKIDFTRYIAKVNATKPFMLSFAEAYDPSWIAHVNGERIESIPLYSVTNGFWINQTGQLQITIEYEPQKWFYYGSITSVTAFLTCLTYLTYNSTKNKKILKRIKSTPTQIKEFIQKSESKHA